MAVLHKWANEMLHLVPYFTLLPYFLYPTVNLLASEDVDTSSGGDMVHPGYIHDDALSIFFILFCQKKNTEPQDAL